MGQFAEFCANAFCSAEPNKSSPVRNDALDNLRHAVFHTFLQIQFWTSYIITGI